MEDSQLDNRGGVAEDTSCETEKTSEKVASGIRGSSVVGGEEVPQSSQEGTWPRSEESCEEAIIYSCCQGGEKSKDTVNRRIIEGMLTQGQK